MVWVRPPRRDSPPANWRPRKDAPKPSTNVKPCTSLQTQLQTEFSVDNKGAAKKAPSRSVAIDPMSFHSSFDDSDSDGDETTKYHTARSRTQTGFETADPSTRSRYRQSERHPAIQLDRPTATSTRKPDRPQAEIQTPSPDSDAPVVSPIPATQLAPTPLSPDDQKDRRFAEALSEAMAKGLKPLLDNKDAKVKPTIYRGSKDGLIDGWIMMTRRHLTRYESTTTSLD